MNDRVTSPKRLRRDHSPNLKRELVARALVPGASVAAIALEAGINANLLFTWRRRYLDGMAAAPEPVLLPVTIAAPAQEEALPTSAPSTPLGPEGSIEIDLAGARVRLSGRVDEAGLRCVLQTLHALA